MHAWLTGDTKKSTLGDYRGESKSKHTVTPATPSTRAADEDAD